MQRPAHWMILVTFGTALVQIACGAPPPKQATGPSAGPTPHDAWKRSAVWLFATERGATKAVMLPVSGAFHSPLLEESGRSFAGFLDGFEISHPKFPVIANVSGMPVSAPDVIRDALSRQLTSPVRWTETMTFARDAGCTEFLELGPGRILMGLARRIDRSLKVTSVGTFDQVQALRG